MDWHWHTQSINPPPFTMSSSIYLVSTSTILFLSHLVTTIPSTSASLAISKREAVLVSIIEQHAVTLDHKKFEYDPVMVQASTDSEYSRVRQKKGDPRNVIFYKKNPDAGKDAIVLSSAENLFAIPTPRGGLKRQFVLLKKSPTIVENGDDSDIPYFGSFVYVRSLLQNDSSHNIFEINGTKTVVEWDIWETRRPTFYAGWDTCDFTALFTCESIYEMLLDANNELETEGKQKKKSRGKRESDVTIVYKPPPPLTPIQAEKGFDPNEYNDLYLDLDFHRPESLQFGRRRAGSSTEGRKKRSLHEETLKRVKRQFGWGGGGSKGGKKFGDYDDDNGNDDDYDGGSKPKPKPKPKAKPKAEVKPKGRIVLANSGNGGASVSAPPAPAPPEPAPQSDADADEPSGSGGFGGFGSMFGNMIGGVAKGPNRLKEIISNPVGTVGQIAGGGNLGGLLGGASFSSLTGGSGIDSLIGGALGGEGVGSLLGGAQGAVSGLLGKKSPLELVDGVGGGSGSLLGGLLGGSGHLLSVGKDVGLGSIGVGGLLGGGGNILSVNPLGGILGKGDADPVSGIVGNLVGTIGAAGPLSGILKGGNPVGALTGVVGNLDGLLGGTLKDVGIGGISGAAASILGGGSGPLGILTNLIPNGLGGAGALRALVGPASGVFDAVDKTVKGLAMGISGNLLKTLDAGGEGGMSGGVGGVVSNILGGAGNPLQMTEKILGPIAGSLDPVNAVVAAANGIVSSLPNMGVAMGQNILGSLPGITDSINLGGLIGSIGLGPVVAQVTGLTDSIVAQGSSLINSGDIMGNGVIDGASKSLVGMGIPLETAKLSALGSHLALNVGLLKLKGDALGLRLGSNLLGSVLNGGQQRGAGAGPSSEGFGTWQKWMNSDGMSSNDGMVFGMAYPGAGNGKDFFFPRDALIRSSFKSDSGTLLGFFRPSPSPESSNYFFPDDPAQAEKYWGVNGLLIPEAFKQPNRDALFGIRGVYERFHFFRSDSKPLSAVHSPDDLNSASRFWLPPDIALKGPQRPKKTADGQPIIYGYMFHGMPESPHIFIPEGDSLTGFFVPFGNNPKVKETPHGVLIPDHSAGHAKFALENPHEFANAKEYRGAFLPDAMNLAGGFSGTLVRSENTSFFTFVLDRLAVDFAFIKGHPSTKNIWAIFLSKEEWQYTPPPVPPPPKDEDKKPSRRKRALLNIKLGGKKEFFGIKVTTQKTQAFLPENYPFNVTIIPLDKVIKYSPMVGRVEPGKPNKPWKVTILEKKVAKAPQVTIPILVIFVPNGYTRDDAFLSLLALKPDQIVGEVLVADKQLQSEHFWTEEQEIWSPEGFKEYAKNEKKKEAKAPPPAEATVPGVRSKASLPPRKHTNCYFGPQYVQSPDMEENVLGSIPHAFHFGYYFWSSKSTGPLFVPDRGVKAVFTPSGGSAQKATFFPARDGNPSLFIPDDPASIPDGSKGSLQTIQEGNVTSESSEKIKATVKGTTLEFSSDVEIIPGWGYATAQVPQPGEASGATPEHYQSGKKDLRYALVDVGAGFKAVVVEGPAALDDANNPIFQRFLHYKARRDGHVNPWGKVAILEPVIRMKPDDPLNLSGGSTKDFLRTAPKTGPRVLKSFRLNNWEWPLARLHTENPGAKSDSIPESLVLGEKRNIVSMLDFRMYVLRKYSCKRAIVDGRTITLLAPRSASSFMDIQKPALPLAEWLRDIVTEKDTLVVPKLEAILGLFSSLFKIDLDDTEKLLGQPRKFKTNMAQDMMSTMMGRRKKRGAGDQSPKWSRGTPNGEWGSEAACDEIALSEMALAQISQEQAGGVDLGLQLTEKIGSSMTYTQVASKLLGNVEKKRNQPPGLALDQLATTDLNGDTDMLVKGVVLQKKRTEVTSKEVGNTKVSVGRRRRRDAEGTEVRRAKNMPGWKTQHRRLPWKDKVTLSDDGVIWYGLGNCKQEEPPPLTLLQSKEPSKVIEYYLKVFRVDCMSESRDKVRDLFNEKMLMFDEDRNYLEVATSNHIVNAQRLTPREIIKLSLAFELSAFSKTYHKLRSDNNFPTKGFMEEADGKISRSAGFLTELTMHYIQRARKVSPSHSVRLTRNLLKTLRTVLTKLHQDKLALEQHCSSDCQTDKMLTQGDKFRITSLLQFVIFGLGPYEKKGADLRTTFDKFVKLNTKAIKERVEEFERQFPDPQTKKPKNSR